MSLKTSKFVIFASFSISNQIYFLLDEPVNGTTQVSSYYKNESNCPFRGYTEQNHSIFGCQQISRIITIKTIIGFSGMGIVGYGEPIDN